ncbi:MAG TPA: glycosyl hydrolase family 8 [Candidatus Bathyarchaeia archaeon]|nr:glycosyl hydrolase family 8 [Candidatus Bathyarchaeia archaeon]
MEIEAHARARASRAGAIARRLAAGALLLALLAPRAVGAQVNHPFGQHPMPYAAGAILPDDASQATLDQAVRDFYDAWKATYLKQACGPGRYYVATHTQPGNLTVSEGHGYGMVLTALMAGHDPDARAEFDGMYVYFREHPTATHQSLMSWYQNGACRDAQGSDSATDGDLDIAYALLLADKQWGSCGAIDYLAEAKKVLADVKDGDLDATASYTLLGDWVSASDPQYYPSTRTSDFMLDHFRSFAAATGDSAWTNLLDHTYALIDGLQTTWSPTTGLLPDFAVHPLTTPAPAPAFFLEGRNDGAYDYNACRDPWRIATDFVASGDARARNAAGRIDSWIRSATGGDPSRIKSGYQLDGTMSSGADYLSMAFVAPLAVGAMVDATNQSWLDALWNLIVATPLSDGGYYENTLKLLAMIVVSGNWWAPEQVAGGCSSSGTPLCTNGGSVSGARLTLGRLGGTSGDETLALSGNLLLPGGIPAPPLLGGAQLLVEDLGNGSAAVFDLTAADRSPVPPAAAGPCNPHDGWKVQGANTTYRNVSNEIDPPACAAGSARGLTSFQLKPGSAFDLDFTVKTRRSSIAPPVGPLRATLVLGITAADGQAGRCGLSAPLACTGAGASRRCR